MTPGDPLHEPGREYILLAGSLEPTGDYRFIDSVTRLGITDKRDNTKLRVLSSNAKTTMGIVGCPLLVAYEPGAWQVVGGELMQ